MRRKLGMICMFLGTILILIALSLVLFNKYEDNKAGNSAEDILATLKDRTPDPDSKQIDTTSTQSDTVSNKESSGINSKNEQAGSNFENSKNSGNSGNSGNSNFSFSNQEQSANRSSTGFSMSQTSIGGYEYIGYLSIPALNRELPVMAEWSYPRLRISPCRFSGSIETNDLVIMAHNYSRHFGQISSLQSGDLVVFTDVNGVASIYEVAEVDTLNPTAVEEMTSREWPLTLFTCTYGGQSRITVRCVKS